MRLPLTDCPKRSRHGRKNTGLLRKESHCSFMKVTGRRMTEIEARTVKTPENIPRPQKVTSSRTAPEVLVAEAAYPGTIQEKAHWGLGSSCHWLLTAESENRRS